LGYNAHMRRREFMLLPALAIGASALPLRADHHIISLNPLIVDFDLSTQQGRYTAIDAFYIRNHFEVPTSPSPPILSIEGEVQKPLRLAMEDLEGLAKKQGGAVLECAGDPAKVTSLVSDGLWEGWHLGDVLALAGPKKEGAFVRLLGRDGYARSVSIERAMNDGMLVTKMNARPLVRNHGAPWRALFPGWYGADSVKWLDRILLSPAPLPPDGDTYLQVWQGPAGSLERKPLPRVLVNSVITSPTEGAVLHSGKIPMRGLAWSGSGKIRDVQASSDGGKQWRPARFDVGESEYDWVQWQAELEIIERGPVELVSRATDTGGNFQPPSRDSRRVDYYGNNTWSHVRCVVV
jgi:DMSO/TMAO reductase YedYZ molybdopterin-dependent catalytic subunit